MPLIVFTFDPSANSSSNSVLQKALYAFPESFVKSPNIRVLTLEHSKFLIYISEKASLRAGASEPSINDTFPV